VEKVTHGLNQDRKPVNGSRILVLGVAYKRDIDDMRESPALDVMRLLEEQGAEVVYHDPHVPTFREDGHVRESVALDRKTLATIDAVVIVTDHRAVDYQLIVDEVPLVIDSRNVTAGTTSSRARVILLAAPQRGAAEMSATV
jgi:UDP-N-acetyl-D-glucosamine dehydrogenase